MKSVKMFISACAVYAIVAACSAMDPGREPASRAPVVGTGGDGGRSVPPTSGNMGGITDPVPSANADPVGGTRLKPILVTGSDGSKSYVRGVWFDVDLQMPCVQMYRIGHGTHCVPTSYPGLNATSVAARVSAMYADDICTVGLVNTDASYPDDVVPTIAVSLGSEIVYRVGERYMGPLYYGTQANCRALDGFDGYKFYLRAEQIEDDALVVLTPQAEL